MLYDANENRPATPNEPLGPRRLYVLEQGQVGMVQFFRPKQEYKMMGWYKLARDLAIAPYKGKHGTLILAMVAVDDAARWLCGEDPCVLLATKNHPSQVTDLLINNKSCCASNITVPPEFIKGLYQLFGIIVDSTLCKAHIEKPLEFVDDVSLLIQVHKLLTDPERGFGLRYYPL